MLFHIHDLKNLNFLYTHTKLTPLMFEPIRGLLISSFYGLAPDYF